MKNHGILMVSSLDFIGFNDANLWFPLDSDDWELDLITKTSGLMGIYTPKMVLFDGIWPAKCWFDGSLIEFTTWTRVIWWDFTNEQIRFNVMLTGFPIWKMVIVWRFNYSQNGSLRRFHEILVLQRYQETWCFREFDSDQIQEHSDVI